MPDSEKPHNDLVDIMIEACKTQQEVETEDGKKHIEMVLDSEKVWWKTQSVNSPTFSRLTYELKTFESKAIQCFNHMAKDRANVLANQILDIGKNYRCAIDAKSSESLRDKHNNQPTLIDKINRNKVERAITIKDEVGRSMMDGLLGKEKKDAVEN